MSNKISIIYDIVKSLTFTRVFGIQRIWNALIFFFTDMVKDEETTEVLTETCPAYREVGNGLHYGLTKSNIIQNIFPLFKPESHCVIFKPTESIQLQQETINETIFEKIKDNENIQQILDILTAIIYNEKIKKLQKIQAIVFILSEITNYHFEDSFLWSIANYYFLYDDEKIGLRRFCGEFWHYKRQNS